MPATSAREPGRIEQSALRLSAIGYFVMAGGGIFFALWAGSDAIMLDGVYSAVSLMMVLLAGRVARLAEQPASEDFHFGYAHFEPLLNLVRGMLVFGICAFALVTAVRALLAGGRAIQPGIAVVYAVSAVVISVALAWFQKRAARRAGGSPALEVDARNWIVDGMMSLGVAAAFIGATLIDGTRLEAWLPYVDPAMVTFLILFMIKTPLITIRDNLLEVLQVAPEPGLQEEIRERFNHALAQLPSLATRVSMVKIGRFFYVMGHVVLEKDFNFAAISEMDRYRERIREELSPVHNRLIADIVFTADPRWVDPLGAGDRSRF